MKMINLRDKVSNGYRPVVRFKKHIEDVESYFEGFMKARIVNVGHLDDDAFSFVFNVSEFNDYNAEYESSDYYDTMGVPRLTATEANMHPCRNHMCETVYFATDATVEGWFEIVSDASTELYKRYENDTKSHLSYVDWLEAKVIKLENEAISLTEK